jgi:Xaa-Pro aminopeptidase
LLLTAPTDRQYAAGFASSYGYVLILPEKAFLLTDSRYTEAARETARDTRVLEVSAKQSAGALLRELLAEAGIKSIGVQEESLSFAQYKRLETELGVEFVPAQSLTKSLRQIKEPYEIENIVAAQRIAEKALDSTLPLLREGVSEREIAAELEYQMMRGGGQGAAFETICVSGERSSLPHGVPGDRRLRHGDFITVDFGCKVNGYCSDMTRTLALGYATDEMRRVYDIVLRAQAAGISALRAGASGKAVDGAARKLIAKEGYGDFFGHGLGHCLGLDIHEEPSASPRGAAEIPAGAVITCEPGIYLPGRFGVRIEDLLLVTQTGCENLTHAPKSLIVL